MTDSAQIAFDYRGGKFNLPKLVAIHSPARQHGKTTIANVFGDHGYRPHKFAVVLYAMWTALCTECGLSDHIIGRTLTGTLKETPLPEVGGLSFRIFAEGIGTKWGREMIDPELWVRIARSTLTARLSGVHFTPLTVNDDMRFENEFDLVKELGGLCIKVIRPGGNKPTLPSEGHLEKVEFDVVFVNDGTIEQLQERVSNWLLWTAGGVDNLLPESF